jgi:hypothetical protein
MAVEIRATVEGLTAIVRERRKKVQKSNSGFYFKFFFVDESFTN